jgi:2-methylcitrate dehydratase
VLSSSTALEQLAQLASGVSYQQLPEKVIEKTKDLLIDTVACAYGAFNSNLRERLVELIDSIGGHSQSALIGVGESSSAPLATLFNGSLIRYLDCNDYYFGTDPGHPSGNFAVGLAVGQREQVSGQVFITAMVMAYEIHMRLCNYAGEPSLWKRGWHHSTNVAFSSAALAARLSNQSASEMAHAMAIAATHQNTLAQLQNGGVANMKATAEAWVAKAGVEAALLAKAGITGPLDLLEGSAGWISTVAQACLLDGLLSPVERYLILESNFKPYPAVATTMSAIACAIDFHQTEQIDSDHIEKIVIRLPSFVLGTPAAGEDRRYPKNLEAAQHSLYYCVAIALHDGACQTAQFTGDKLFSPRIQSLLSKVKLIEDPALTQGWPAAGGGIDIETKEGQIIVKTMTHPPGHPCNPISKTQLEEKFHAYVDPILGQDRAQLLLMRLRSIENCHNLNALSPYLVAMTN